MLEANFWQDKAKSQKIIKEKKLYEDLINSHKKSTLQFKDLDDLYILAIEEKNSEIQAEVYQKLKELRAKVKEKGSQTRDFCSWSFAYCGCYI